MTFALEYLIGTLLLALLTILFYKLLINRDKRHSARVKEDLRNFEGAIEKNNIDEIHRYGLVLVRNIHLTDNELIFIQQEVKKRLDLHPKLEELALAIHYKKTFGLREFPI